MQSTHTRAGFIDPVFIKRYENNFQFCSVARAEKIKTARLDETSLISRSLQNMSFAIYAVAALLFWLYKFLTKNDDYFEKKGIPFEKPKLIIGSRTDLITRSKSILKVVDDWYLKFRNDK